jgi:hypothetical protein
MKANNEDQVDFSALSVEVLYQITNDALFAEFNRNDSDPNDPSSLNVIPKFSGLDPELTIEQIGERYGPLDVTRGAAAWPLLKNEFRILMCTNDKKYASIRKEFSKAGSKTQLAIVSSIAAAVGASLGVVLGSLVPFCAICFIAVLKMGKEAFCHSYSLDVKVGPTV